MKWTRRLGDLRAAWVLGKVVLRDKLQRLVLAQLEMAELGEIFLGYALTGTGKSLYAELKEHQLGGLLSAPGAIRE